MKMPNCCILGLITLLALAGCAKTTVTDREQVVTGKLPRPGTIWIYDFVATPADLPIKTSLDREYFSNNEPKTPEQIADVMKKRFQEQGWL